MHSIKCYFVLFAVSADNKNANDFSCPKNTNKKTVFTNFNIPQLTDCKIEILPHNFEKKKLISFPFFYNLNMFIVFCDLIKNHKHPVEVSKLKMPQIAIYIV